jgi:hypothetical protein
MTAIANRSWVPYPNVRPVPAALAEADGYPETPGDGAVVRTSGAATREARREQARLASAESRYLVTDELLP